jgi:hypothetical protein
LRRASANGDCQQAEDKFQPKDIVQREAGALGVYVRTAPEDHAGSARGAMAGLMAEVAEDHVRTHLVDPGVTMNTETVELLLEVVRTYLK